MRRTRDAGGDGRADTSRDSDPTTDGNARADRLADTRDDRTPGTDPDTHTDRRRLSDTHAEGADHVHELRGLDLV